MAAQPIAAPVDAPRMRADAVRNRERILEAARTLMARDGAGADMADIAREAGVGVGTLYRRFPDKEALIAELVREKFLGLRELMQSWVARRELTARERLDGYIGAACEVQGRDKGLFEAMSVASAAHQQIARETEGLIEALDQLVQEAREESSVRDDLTWEDVVMCTCALGHVTQIEDDLPGTVARLLEIQLDGLDPRR
jgi:AcrR family transcriptional regulator